ncbi:MAG: L-2-hydroxyglutarate oxidase [Desulfobacula sp.]|uniref:L-2-hydroxyglutarate oxidase n=1 Tax=Desulfobacula sp. TaxID=2593537 RepID=UPI0025BC0A63|nr:L-2-hydroxyglutarate oxidase [Desulfobacula sp.]MCD4722289.1 L-2-hydroxyglutarate oxidase [Desulfobacula sp.]
MTQFDFAVIGGGIVGVATALTLKQRYPSTSVALIEKETFFASHQTGHNSGVIHAGVYYQPGSLKAKFCKRGAALMLSFCKEHHLPYKQCGKLLVATDLLEFQRMTALEKRCALNKITTHRIEENRLRQVEPNITGLGALLVPETAITDYKRITHKMVDLFLASKGIVKTGRPVTSIKEKSNKVVIYLGSEAVHTRYLIVCGGLQADRLARMMNIDIDFMIIPFRGEYYQLPKQHFNIVSRLIYPIPDPDLPFLGVHLTPMVNGSVTVGPNAVLGWKREGYHQLNLNIKDTAQMLCFPGFWHIIRQNVISGIKELVDSNYKPGYLKRIQKYCPLMNLKDLKPYPAGIRAQAVKKDGTLVHDFLFAESPRSLHVCNAPSPAATSAIPISEYLCDKAEAKFKHIG